MDRPDSPDGELIKYMVYSTFIPCLSFSPSCLVDYFLHISLLLTHYITFFILVGWPFYDSCQHDSWSIWAVQSRINKGMYTFFHSYMGVFNMTETIMGLNACWLVRCCDLKKPATMHDYGHMPNPYIYNMCQHGKGRINALSLVSPNSPANWVILPGFHWTNEQNDIHYFSLNDHLNQTIKIIPVATNCKL